VDLFARHRPTAGRDRPRGPAKIYRIGQNNVILPYIINVDEIIDSDFNTRLDRLISLLLLLLLLLL